MTDGYSAMLQLGRHSTENPKLAELPKSGGSRYMSTGPQHERYAAWFERRRGPRDAQDEADLLAIADAYDAAIMSGSLSAEQLESVVEGASSPRGLLRNNATKLLMKLSGRWPIAADAISNMFCSRQAHVRFAALCSLGRETPVSVTEALLKAGLRDKSSRVRWKAADRANCLERRNLVPEINAALNVESNDKARRSIELDLRMLRDGYWVEHESPGWTSVTARLHNGGITCRAVSNDEFRAKGLEGILAELRK